MSRKLHRELYEQEALSKPLFEHLEAIKTLQKVSVYSELRLVLYLGILCLTGGLSMLIYKNIGELGHYLAMVSLLILFVGGFYLLYNKALPFTTTKSESPLVYFDYLVLLVALICLLVQGYMQFLFAYLDSFASVAALFTGVLFLFMAYRYDHIGVLFMALTAFAALFGVNVPNSHWYNLAALDSHAFTGTAMAFSLFILGLGLLGHKLAWKTHFTFSYVNLASFLFLATCTSALFDTDYEALYILLILIASGLSVFYAVKSKSFSMLIYSAIFAYIALTYMLVLILPFGFELAFFYFMVSAAGLVLLVLKNRKILQKD